MGSAKGTFGKNFKSDGKSQELNNHSQIYSYLLNVTRQNLADKLGLNKLYNTYKKNQVAYLILLMKIMLRNIEMISLTLLRSH